MLLEHKIESEDNLSTVRHVLKEHFGLSNRLILKLKKLDLLYINNVNCKLNSIVNIGDIVSFSLDYPEDNSNIVPTQMNLEIVFEDESLIIINKPPFMAIHPTTYHFTDTLSNGIKYYYDSIGLKKKIRPVNRLDRNTSGLVVFAKNEYIQEDFIKQMSSKLFEKKYLGIIEGKLENSEGIINKPISRKENSIIERKIDDNGFDSITHYNVLAVYQNYSLVEFYLETGRTHQIRVHMKHIGHPLVGDSLYGSPSSLINRQALHSYYISFMHPINHKKMIFKAPLPSDMNSLLNN